MNVPANGERRPQPGEIVYIKAIMDHSGAVVIEHPTSEGGFRLVSTEQTLKLSLSPSSMSILTAEQLIRHAALNRLNQALRYFPNLFRDRLFRS